MFFSIVYDKTVDLQQLITLTFSSITNLNESPPSAHSTPTFIFCHTNMNPQTLDLQRIG